MSSAVGEAVRLDPALVRFRVSPIIDLQGIVDGDWDEVRIYPVEETVKHKAIIEHIRDGKPWEETELFTDIYRRRLKAGGHVRGEWSLGDLARQYYQRVDGMAADMRKHGFRTHDKAGRPYPLPGLFIGRTGIHIGNQGNHRLAIAHAIGLGEITGKITCRHPLA